MEKYDIREVAKWILKKEDMVTHKRLQKYLYFLYGEYLAKNNNCDQNIELELFHNDFEGWAHGPVSPTIYDIYKGSGYKPLIIHPNCIINICREDEEILNQAYDKYKNYDTDKLEEISHEQEPWKKSRRGLGIYDIGNNPISTLDIYYCFKNESEINS